MTTITGNTYPVKDQIKALGGKWNPDIKGWVVPDNKAEEAQRLVANAPESMHMRKPFAGERSFQRRVCEECGEFIRHPRQRCWVTGGFCA